MVTKISWWRAGLLALSLVGTSAFAASGYSKAGWVHWHGSWHPGFAFGSNQTYMTCVATDGSGPAAEFWAAGVGERAAEDAYQKCMDFVNVAGRNPANVTVECGY